MCIEQEAVVERDLFPRTLTTWIGGMLDAGGGQDGRQRVNQHIMSVYAKPLRVYLFGTPWRTLGDPDDLIQGFFEKRLDNPDFYRKWRLSGRPLRRWLMTGLRFYLYEIWRDQQREPDMEPLPEDLMGESDGPVDESISAEDNLISAYERAFRISIAQRALELAEQQCRARDLERHWEAFLLHHYQGMPLASVARQMGETYERVKQMCRTTRNRFRAAVRELLIEDGTDPDRLDEEIERLRRID